MVIRMKFFFSRNRQNNREQSIITESKKHTTELSSRYSSSGLKQKWCVQHDAGAFMLSCDRQCDQ